MQTLLVAATIQGKSETECSAIDANGLVLGQIADHRLAHRRKNFAGLRTVTTSHVERAFLSVRQELKRFERKGLGYSKSLEMHKLAVALHFGVYNFVRKHITALELRQPWPQGWKRSHGV